MPGLRQDGTGALHPIWIRGHTVGEINSFVLLLQVPISTLCRIAWKIRFIQRNMERVISSLISPLNKTFFSGERVFSYHVTLPQCMENSFYSMKYGKSHIKLKKSTK